MTCQFFTKKINILDFKIGLILTTTMFLSGCGYVFQSKQNTLIDVKTVYIEPFVNNSYRYNVGLMLTNALSREFVRSGKLTIVNDKSQADAIFKGIVLSANSVIAGAVSSESLSNKAVTGGSIASLYVAVIDAKMEFVNLKNNKIIWTGRLTNSRSYNAKNDFGIAGETNGIQNVSAESKTFETAAELMMINVHDAIFQSF